MRFSIVTIALLCMTASAANARTGAARRVFVPVSVDTVKYAPLSLDSLKVAGATAASIDSVLPRAQVHRLIDSVQAATHRRTSVPNWAASYADVINANPKLLAIVKKQGLTSAGYAMAFIRVDGAWVSSQAQQGVEDLGENGAIIASMIKYARNEDVPFVRANEDALVRLGFPRPPKVIGDTPADQPTTPNK